VDSDSVERPVNKVQEAHFEARKGLQADNPFDKGSSNHNDRLETAQFEAERIELLDRYDASDETEKSFAMLSSAKHSSKKKKYKETGQRHKVSFGVHDRISELSKKTFSSSGGTFSSSRNSNKTHLSLAFGTKALKQQQQQSKLVQLMLTAQELDKFKGGPRDFKVLLTLYSNPQLDSILLS